MLSKPFCFNLAIMGSSVGTGCTCKCDKEVDEGPVPASEIKTLEERPKSDVARAGTMTEDDATYGSSASVGDRESVLRLPSASVDHIRKHASTTARKPHGAIIRHASVAEETSGDNSRNILESGGFDHEDDVDHSHPLSSQRWQEQQAMEVKPAHSGAFTIKVDKDSGKRKQVNLGIDTIACFDREAGIATLMVEKVREEGLVNEWNRSHPEYRVQIGDHVVAINGEASDHDAMHQVAKKARQLELSIRRYSWRG